MDLPTITTDRLFMHIPTALDAAAYARYYGENIEHLRPWEPVHAPDTDQANFWERLLPVYRDEYLGGGGLRFAMRLREEPQGPLVGMCHVMQIQRGASHSCVIGYSVDVQFEGRGFMTEALRATIGYAFGPMQLHRLQATYMPTNLRSARILRKLGFVVEGYVHDYLFIDGAWRDHLFVALVNPAHRSQGDLQDRIPQPPRP